MPHARHGPRSAALLGEMAGPQGGCQLRCPYPLYRTAGYSFSVAHSVAICSARRSRIGFFIWALWGL